MGLKVFTTPSVPLTGDRNPSRKGKDVTALQGFFSKIIPSFFVDKASCTRQFESKLSLNSLASLFPIKEGFFENLPVLPYPQGKLHLSPRPSHPQGRGRKPLLLVARNRYALRLADQSGLRQIVRDGTAGRGKFIVYSLQLIFGGFC